MNILIFDTETSGFNENRLLQLAYQVYNEDRELISSYKTLIYPDFEIEKGAQDVHGITKEKARRHGVCIDGAMHTFIDDYNECDVLVAHNIEFDLRVINREIKILTGDNLIHQPKKVDTMKQLTEFCKLPNPKNRNTYKWPRLTELHNILFGESFDGAHDAMNDVKACARCYFEAIDRGLIK